MPDHRGAENFPNLRVDGIGLLIQRCIPTLRQVVQRIDQGAYLTEQLLILKGDIGGGEGLTAVIEHLQLGQSAQGVAVADEKLPEVPELFHVFARGSGQGGASVSLREHPQ